MRRLRAREFSGSGFKLMTTCSPQSGLRLGMMQPYFLPYLGYFSLIKHTDLWVVFDSAQFIKGGWIERNRVLHPHDGWVYIQVPLEKHPSCASIAEVKLRKGQPWRERLLAQLAHYKKAAPYYAQVISLLKDAVDTELEGIAALNVHLLEKCCCYLEMPFRYTTFSTCSVFGSKVRSPDEWALETAKAFGAAEYINAPGGMTFFDNAKYENAGLRLTFLKPRLIPYDQKRDHFVSGLSIIDVMMFNNPSTIRDMLDEVDLVPGGTAEPVVGE